MDKKIKLLLIDDDQEMREMYAEIFRNANFEVIEAVDGVEGLDKATKQLPDIIFTGIVMPRMDGFTMIESLQKTVMTSNIPVVISSHMGREEDRVRSEKLGVKDFIIRGTTRPLEVLDRINSLFIGSGKEYKLKLDYDSSEARDFAKEMSIPASFACLDCGERLVLNLKLTNPQDRIFEAKFVCGACGSVVK